MLFFQINFLLSQSAGKQLHSSCTDFVLNGQMNLSVTELVLCLRQANRFTVLLLTIGQHSILSKVRHSKIAAVSPIIKIRVLSASNN